MEDRNLSLSEHIAQFVNVTSPGTMIPGMNVRSSSYRVTIDVGYQHFELRYDPDLEEEATWMRRQLIRALTEALVRIAPVQVASEREKMLRSLLEEVMRSHRDKESPDYNQCEEGECEWCRQAGIVLGEKS